MDDEKKIAANPLKQSKTGQIEGSLKVDKELQIVAKKGVKAWSSLSDIISAWHRLIALYLKRE